MEIQNKKLDEGVFMQERHREWQISRIGIKF